LNFFNFDLRKVLFIIVVLTIPFLLIKKKGATKGESTEARPIAVLAGLIQNTYSSFSSGIKGTTGLYLNLIGVKKDNHILKNKNARLKTKLSELQELKLENQRLNKMLGFRKSSAHGLLAAKIIGRDLFSEHDTLTINRGSQHHLKNGMAIITNAGVVGYILNTSLYSSQIILLTDRYAAIDAHVQRTRARGILEGQTKDYTLLSYLRRESDVKKGDIIVTSGLNHIFPKGLPIGTVDQVKKSQYGISQEVKVIPTVNISQLEEVFVVLKPEENNAKPGLNKDTKRKEEVGS